MDVKLPKLGEGAESGTIVNILVKVGDEVTQGQTLLELENEKAVAPIPSPASGRIAQLRVKEGDKVSVGQVLVVLSSSASAAPASAAAKPAPRARATEPAPEPTPAELVAGVPLAEEEPAPSASGLPPAASPSIRKLARDLGIDLARVRGSERGGRIVLKDLKSYIERLRRLAAQPTAPQPSAPVAAPEQVDFAKWGKINRKPMSSLRQIISRRMVENWSTIPHVTQFDEADVTVPMDWRKRYAPAYEQEGVKLTLTPFILKAVATVLQKHPIFNSSLDEAAHEIVLKEYVHLGLAVDTDQGLLVPVIRDVDKKSLLDLSREVTELANKARDRKISLEEMRGGTFTISNQGGIGGGPFTPIVNKPEVAILGLGRGALKPVVKGTNIEPRTLLPLALSYDHRVIDGGSAARFMVDLVRELEHFKEEDARL